MKFQFKSHLNISPDLLWAKINNFEKLNKELWPVMQMTCPDEYRRKAFHDFPIGLPVFKSLILLFGFLPVERSNVRFLSVTPGGGFSEDSEMILCPSWKHKRTITPDGDGSIIMDELDITPRSFIFKPVLFLITRLTFFNRHGKLKRL